MPLCRASLLLVCILAVGCNAERRAVSPVKDMLIGTQATPQVEPSKPGRLEKILAEAARPSPDAALATILFNTNTPKMSLPPAETENEQEESCPYEITVEESMRTGA